MSLRMAEELGSLLVNADPARTEVPRRPSADLGPELSRERDPPEDDRAILKGLDEAQARGIRAAQL